jgi:hypothetical protein
MAEMLDCLVTYYSATAHCDGMPLQYVCYQVVSGPGPTAAGGVAVITLVGAKNPRDSNLYHHLHAVQVGGPDAALKAALKYLDAIQHKDDLARAQTEVRCTPCLQTSRDELGDSQGDLPLWLPAGIPVCRQSGEEITVLNVSKQRANLH